MSGTAPRRPRRWLPTVVIVGLAALLPLIAAGLRDAPPPACATDGVRLAEPPAARITLADRGRHAFCCILCAKRWLAATGERPSAIEVRDDVSGALIDATTAHYAWSPVIAQPATGDRLHAFAREEDARRHAKTYRGRVLTGRERPFVAEDAP